MRHVPEALAKWEARGQNTHYIYNSIKMAFFQSNSKEYSMIWVKNTPLMRAYLLIASQSALVINSTSFSKVMDGAQPNVLFAFAGLPSNKSTSVGR